MKTLFLTLLLLTPFTATAETLTVCNETECKDIPFIVCNADSFTNYGDAIGNACNVLLTYYYQTENQKKVIKRLRVRISRRVKVAK